MARSGRMFEIAQMLRTARAPLTAEVIAARLEVVKRTIYRDVAALQAAGVPIEGAAGLGYVMRSGFDLPPLMFTPEEIEAIIVGLSLIGRTGDAALEQAGRSVIAKIGEVLPKTAPPIRQTPLLVSSWHAIPETRVDLRRIRRAIRDDQKLSLRYSDADGTITERVVCPLALVYYIDGIILAAHCELRQDFRHFRNDRLLACEALPQDFKGKGPAMRQAWRQQHEVFSR